MNNQERYRVSPVDRIWRFFASMRLALSLLFLLAFVSIAGTIIPQGRSEAFYISTYGAKLADWFTRTQLTHMYNSKWFSFLLVLFGLNLIVCTLERFPAKWRVFNRGELDQNIEYIMSVPNYSSIHFGKGDEKILEQNVKGVLSSNGYKNREMLLPFQTEGFALKGYKGRLHRFGPDLVHIGIVIILIGGIIGSLTGFKEYKPIPVGDTVTLSAAGGGIQIKANRFWMDRYETGEVKQYYSDISILEDGKEVVSHGLLHVNKPLIYNNIWFYQTSYGDAWDRVEDVTLSLYDRTAQKEKGELFRIAFQKEDKIPGLKGYTIKPVAFVADFAIDTLNKNFYAKSTNHNNPAIEVEIYKDGNLLTKNWIFLNFPDIFPVFGKESKHNIVLKSYNATPFTALNVVRDRGVNIVWLGSVLMLIGLFLSFFVQYRRVWVIVEKKEYNLIVHMAGSTKRDKITFDSEFKKMTESIHNNI